MIPETLAFAPLGLGFIPFATPGTQELADATLKEIGRYDVVLWEKHGTIASSTRPPASTRRPARWARPPKA